MAYIPPRPFVWNYCGICGKRLELAHDGERECPYCADCNRHYYRNPVPACCVVLRDAENRLLFVKRAVEPFAGRWALPGGFMELNETGEECALRELAEETGLVGEDARLLGLRVNQSTDKGAVLVIGYCIEKWHGILCAESDASDLRFISREERPDLPFEAHRSLLELHDKLKP